MEHVAGADVSTTASRGTGRAGKRETLPLSSYQSRPRSPSVMPPILQPFFQEIEHLRRRQFHLLAKPLGDDRHIDICRAIPGIGAHAAAVERGEDAGLAAFAAHSR